VYALTIPQHVKIDIFDIRGRLLNSFEEGLKPSGRHTLFWDGIDASGQALASGVYFYRVTAGQETQTGRALLIK
jgi:flagellar hook assembly protein FlgD